MSRLGGRFVPNIEHEVRRQATEPIVKWRQEWVLPSGTLPDGTASSSSSVGVKILKWVRVPDELVTFPEDQDVAAEDRVADDAAIVEAPVQSIHNAPAVPTPIGGSLSSAGGGLGTIAPREPPSTPATAPSAAVGSEVTPASAIPAHLAQSTLSETTSGNDTTTDNTPTDSLANTPAASAPDVVTTQTPLLSQQASSQGGEPAPTSAAGTPQIQPQVESQLHDQPAPEPPTDDATLAALAAGAEAEQPVDQDETLLSTDLNASVPATTFEDDQPGAGAGGDVEMNDA